MRLFGTVLFNQDAGPWSLFVFEGQADDMIIRFYELSEVIDKDYVPKVGDQFNKNALQLIKEVDKELVGEPMLDQPVNMVVTAYYGLGRSVLGTIAETEDGHAFLAWYWGLAHLVDTGDALVVDGYSVGYN